MHPSWIAALAPVAHALDALEHALAEERAAGHEILPPPERILRAFERPLDTVRVLIVGQDPYPTPGHAVGLSFAVEREVRPVPRSLRNIYTELESDVGATPADHGDLTAWADQGVILLNRVLTVRAGDAGSHARLGWEAITDHAIRTLVARDQPLVAVLWGRQAQSLKPLLGPTPIVESAHPSPLSARRGFFGSQPFSQVNQLLIAQGGKPIDWTVR